MSEVLLLDRPLLEILLIEQQGVKSSLGRFVLGAQVMTCTSINANGVHAKADDKDR